MPLQTDLEDDAFDDDSSDDEADDDLESASDDAEEDGDEGDDDDAESDDDAPEEDGVDPPPRASWGERMRRRARGAGGMGRPSTGPAPRPSRAPVAPGRAHVNAAAEASDTELAPDVTAWPGTADAARIAGKHVSTIKLWRTQGRIRAVQDASGCWRHHPDDLAETVDAPDTTDPGTVLAQGMSSIVQQGSNANERLLAMTEIATSGLQTATGVLSTELERAYAKIADLEARLADANEKLAATRELDLKHERYMRRLDIKHEMELSGSKETSARLDGLLTIIGPIAASIAARVLGNLAAAERAEASAIGAAPSPDVAGGASPSSPASSSPASAAAPEPKDDRLVPIETRITDAMTRLCVAVRNLDGPAFQGLRAMMPQNVQQALDDIMDGKTDSAVGQALATLIKAAQGLSDLQFQAIRPITPADIASVLAELRELIRVQSSDGSGEQKRPS